ncbi:hypothetical protein ACFL96_06810 [Thermoproteota archaeon]
MKILRLEHKYWLLMIFLLVLAFRLFFVFQTEYFSQDSYFAIRQVDNILETGRPVFEDELSYSGRLNVFSPTYYYILAGFALILGKYLALKLIPSLFVSLFVLVAYLIAKELTNNTRVSLLIAFFAGFIPSFFLNLLNSVSPMTLFIPLMFFCIYLFMNIYKKFYIHIYVVAIFLLGILSPLSFLFVLGLIIFLLLMKLEYKQQNKLDLELSLFSIFLVLWIQFLFYKKAFLFHGFGVVWQNIPSGILSNYFQEVVVIDVLYAIGLIPLFFGIYTVYKYILKEKNRQVYFIVAFVLSISLLLWLKLIQLNTGLVFLGAALIVLSAQSFKLFFSYFEKTKLSQFKIPLWILVIVVFFLTSMIASVGWANATIEQVPDEEEMTTLIWMKHNMQEEAVVLSPVSEGFLISGVAQKKNVADNSFLLVKDAEVIFNDIHKMYTTKFETHAIELLDKYDVKYIYFSSQAEEEYGIDEIAYVNDRCFPIVYKEDITIYQVRCHVKDD